MIAAPQAQPADHSAMTDQLSASHPAGRGRGSPIGYSPRARVIRGPPSPLSQYRRRPSQLQTQDLSTAFPQAVFGTSPRRNGPPSSQSPGHRRTNTTISMRPPPLSTGDSSVPPDIPRVRGGYQSDLEDSPEMLVLDDVLDDNSTPKPIARKRLAAFTEGTIREESSESEPDRSNNPTPVKAATHAKEPFQQPKLGIPLSLNTDLVPTPPETPGRRRAHSQPPKFQQRRPSTSLSPPSTRLQRPALARGHSSTPPSASGSSPEQVYVNYGISPEDDDFSLINFDSNNLPVSPLHTPPGLGIQAFPLDRQPEGSPTPFRSQSKYQVQSPNHMTDLLYKSPTLPRHSAIASLHSVDDIYLDAPESVAGQDHHQLNTKPAQIPNVETRLLDSLDNLQQDTYLDLAIDQASRNTTAAGVPFMVLTDGRSSIIGPGIGPVDIINDPQDWKRKMKEQSKARCVSLEGGRTSELTSDSPLSPKQAATTVQKKLSSKERKQLEELQTRESLSNHKMIPRLKPRETARMMELLEIQAQERQKQEDAKKESLLHHANDKARKVLGVFHDHSKTHRPGVSQESWNEADHVKPVEKQTKKKLGMFSHGRRASKSLTDVTTTATSTTSSTARPSEDILKPLEPASTVKSETPVTPKHRTKLQPKRASPEEKSKSQDVNMRSSRFGGTLCDRDMAPPKSEIGCPTLISGPTSHLIAPNKESSESGSVASSDYEGSRASMHQGQLLQVLPSPIREPRPTDSYAGMGMMERMMVMNRDKEATNVAASDYTDTAGSRTPTSASVFGVVENSFNPFAGDLPGISKPNIAAGPVTPMTALHSNTPTQAEREYARALTQRNLEEKRHGQTGNTRPSTALELPVLSSNVFEGSENMF